MKSVFSKLAWLVLLWAAAMVLCPHSARAVPPVVKLKTSQGDITLALYPDPAPVTVANFLGYVEEGFYDGLIFHRVIKGFMIQGGGYLPDLSFRPPHAPIVNEADNGLENDPYTIAMARTSDPHSATAQFFINTADNEGLDHVDKTEQGWGYAVFGQVVGGREVVDAIEASPVYSHSERFRSLPVEPVVIQTAETVALDQSLWYPHVASDGSWETDIALINDGETEAHAVIEAYNADGTRVAQSAVFTLSAHARAEIVVGTLFPSSEQIKYIRIKSNTDALVGYVKFYIDPHYRAAVPAVPSPAAGDLYLSHIAAGGGWWTGVALVNTTDEEKSLTLRFNNGETRPIFLTPGEHRAFTVTELYRGPVPSAIRCGVIENAHGVIGLELFGKETVLSGVLLKDGTANSLYYPHVASNESWWTGIVAHNPFEPPVGLSVLPYAADGTALEPRAAFINGNDKYIGTAEALNLPAETAWFAVQANGPVTGFELFGTRDEAQVAGFSALEISRTAGIFPKLEPAGWTGIAFVNVSEQLSEVRLTAYTDAGAEVASQTLILKGYQKQVGMASELFIGQDISQAGYIRYRSDQDLAGFQLNGSPGHTLLDALPGL